MITAVQALYVHDRVIERTGGRHGVRDTGLLESALARPFATFDRRELNPDVFLQAAVLMVGIVKNHPFIDGNKRTGVVLAALHLETEGWVLTARDEEVVAFANEVAESGLDVPEAAEWLRRHAVRG